MSGRRWSGRGLSWQVAGLRWQVAGGRDSVRGPALDQSVQRTRHLVELGCPAGIEQAAGFRPEDPVLGFVERPPGYEEEPAPIALVPTPNGLRDVRADRVGRPHEL